MTAALAQKFSVEALQHTARTDEGARLVLGDTWEELGRLDVARLWRDELPVAYETRGKRKGQPVERFPRVDKLTSSQEKRFGEWRDKWLAIGLSTERADRPKFEAAVSACYRFAGLVPPKVIWCPNPLVVGLAGPLSLYWNKGRSGSDDSVGASVDASVGDSVRDSVGVSVGASVRDSVGASVDDSVRDSVRDSVGASVDDSVRDSVGASVDDSVRDSVGASVGDSVRDSVGASVDDSVSASVGASVRDSVGASVRDSVGASVDDSVGASVRDSVGASVRDSVGASVGDLLTRPLPEVARQVIAKTRWSYMGGQFWVGGYWWGAPAFVSFLLDACRLELSHAQELKARAYAATGESACWWFPTRDYVLVSERPTSVEWHTKPAAKWKRSDYARNNLKRVAWGEWEVKP